MTATRTKTLSVVRDSFYSRVDVEYLRQTYTRPSLRRPRHFFLPPPTASFAIISGNSGKHCSLGSFACFASQCSTRCLDLAVTMKVWRQLWQMCAAASYACFARLSLLVADFTPAASLRSFSFFLSWICFLFIVAAGGSVRATKTQCCFRFSSREAFHFFFFWHHRLSRFGDCSA